MASFIRQTFAGMCYVCQALAQWALLEDPELGLPPAPHCPVPWKAPQAGSVGVDTRDGLGGGQAAVS